MADLRSIDLTEGRRFARSLNKPITTMDNRGTSRLKKGEVPHFSFNDDNTYISISTGDNINITYNTITWNDLNVIDNTVNFTSTNSWSINSISNALTNTIYTQTFDDWTYWTSGNKSSKFKTTHNSKDNDIISRLGKDPFAEDRWYSGCSDIKFRMKNKKYEDTSDSRHRISKDQVNDTFTYDDRDLLRDYKDVDYIYNLQRFDLLQETWSRMVGDDNDFKIMERNLKIKAPFIKRVFTMNRGHSFDSTEFKLEMIKAKENFDAAISRLQV